MTIFYPNYLDIFFSLLSNYSNYNKTNPIDKLICFFQKSWQKCVCGKTFPDKQSLQRHQSAYLCGKDKLPINCNECGFFLGYQGTDMAVKTHKKHMLKEHPEFVKVSY